MSLGLILALALLASGAAFYVRNSRSLPSRTLTVVGLLGLTTCWALVQRDLGLQRDAATRAKILQAVPRQERPEEFVSSDACQACHPSQYTSWHHTFHRTMTQFARPETVRGRFDQVVLSSSDADYHLSKSGDRFAVDIFEVPPGANGSKGGLGSVSPQPKTFALHGEIAMLTGSHRQQVYWVTPGLGNLQIALPFAFLLEDQRWVPLDAIFLRDPTSPPLQLVWNTGCIQCHSTGGQPRPISNTDAFDTRVGELGIACEACHGPAAEHVRANHNPARRYSYHRRGVRDPTIINPVRLPPKLSSYVCGQCHSVKWIPNTADWHANGFHYRPGEDLEKSTPLIRAKDPDALPWIRELLKSERAYLEQRFWPDGMVRVSGREFNGLVESPCYQRGELTCFSCHSLHDSPPEYQVAKDMESNEACLQCHKSYRDNVAAHTHHQPTSSGSLCYNCHMPYTTYGLLKAIRSHQIDSPNVLTTRTTGRPNACNLCHLDRSLGWTADHLSDWYKLPSPALEPEDQTVAATVDLALRGDAGQRALTAWSLGWKPAREASGEDWLAPYLALLLDDPYATVRYIAARSLRRLPGFEGLAYDYVGPAAERAAARQRALAQWQSRLSGQSTPARSGVLLGADRQPDWPAIERLLRRRDNRPMDLRE